MDAIVYTTNTGFTREYAQLLSQSTGLAAYTLKDAAKHLSRGASVIYLGWLMAGSVKGYKKAAGLYDVRAVCGVGMGKTGAQEADVRSANRVCDDIPVFTLQGGFDIRKLHGIYRLMMMAMVKGVGARLSEKRDKTPDEEDMLDLMVNGGSRVSEKELSALLEWYGRME